MESLSPVRPAFSHGGPSVPGWPAVAGTGTGPGRPIAIYHAAGLNWPAFLLIATGGMTVAVEVNPGPLGSDGNPDPNSWVAIYTKVFAGAGSDDIALSPAYPYVRSNITAYSAGALTSAVPCIPLPSGQQASAQYPTKVQQS